jgi:perosamine synthetase
VGVKTSSLLPWWWNDISEEAKLRAKESLWSNRFTLGEETQRLERELSSIFDSNAAVLNSGTSSIYASLVALGIGDGDEVIIPALTWVATAQAVLLTGATPVLADVEPLSCLISLEGIKEIISDRTKAIIVVNFNGKRLDSERRAELLFLRDKYGLRIIEDSCKAMGSEYLGKPNSLSDTQCFSLGMISYLSAGYGGFVLSQDYKRIESVKIIRDHGVIRNEESENYKFHGANLKISDVSSSLVIPQLKELGNRVEKAKSFYSMYLQELESLGIGFFQFSREEAPTYMQIICHSKEQRNSLNELLKKQNIESKKYHDSLTKIKYISEIPINASRKFPHSDSLSERLLTLPSGNKLTEDTINRVCMELSRIE